MHFTAPFLPPTALANDIAVVARRNGKTAPAYLKARMIEALMNDVAADVIGRYDFSSDTQIAGAMKRVRALSNELILAMAQFRYDATRRRQMHRLRRKNTEGKLSAAQNDFFKKSVDENEDFAIVKAIALLEARRRGLKTKQLHQIAPAVFSK